jgi:hypothetical protein
VAQAFLDSNFPVRPAYRLCRAADMLRQQGCTQLADQYDAAGDQLTQQIAVVGLGGLSGWMRGAITTASVADEEAAVAASVDSEAAGVAGASESAVLLGGGVDITRYISENPAGKFDRLSVRGK